MLASVRIWAAQVWARFMVLLETSAIRVDLVLGVLLPLNSKASRTLTSRFRIAERELLPHCQLLPVPGSNRFSISRYRCTELKTRCLHMNATVGNNVLQNDLSAPRFRLPVLAYGL